MPPDQVCTHCGTTEPDFTFVPVNGKGVVRSWTVVRQSFLPGFTVPYALVDVELDDAPGVRLIGQLTDGPDAQIHLGQPVQVRFEDLSNEISVPAFSLVPAA
jgi:uncharacterized OB-fold protein